MFAAFLCHRHYNKGRIINGVQFLLLKWRILIMLKNHVMKRLIVGGLALTGSMLLTFSAQAASEPGSLSYHKASEYAAIGDNYQQFKLYNHVPNSQYKNIKTISWKKAKLSNHGVTNKTVHIDLYATQGTQYNWYRISKVNVLRGKKVLSKNAKQKVQKYWVYGQALVLPKVTTQTVFN